MVQVMRAIGWRPKLGIFLFANCVPGRKISAMSVEQIEQSVLKLSDEERRRFAEWFYEHEDQLAGPDYIHPEVQAEILWRRDEALAHPERLESWEGTTERVRARLHEIRDQKAKAG